MCTWSLVSESKLKGLVWNGFVTQLILSVNTDWKMDAIMVSRGVAYFVAIMLSIFSVVGTVGNLWTIVALWKSKLRKQSSTKLIISLAVCDLLICSLTFPPIAQQHTGMLCIDIIIFFINWWFRPWITLFSSKRY